VFGYELEYLEEELMSRLGKEFEDFLGNCIWSGGFTG